MNRRSRFVVTLLASVLSLHAGMFHVSLDGDDSASGSDAAPFRTIQRAVEAAQPGDAVTVHAGVYDERVTTVRGGTGATHRISLEADGTVELRGFSISHPYITVKGFEISGHSTDNITEGYVEVLSGGNYVEVFDNTVRDGIFVVGPDFTFNDNFPQGGTITRPSGGFLQAGFEVGQTIMVGKGTNTVAPKNDGTWVIVELTDDSITVDGYFMQDGPLPAYLSGSYAYGLVVRTGAENCVVRGNVFTNLSYDAWFVGGATNLFENNRIEHCHGWDNMHFMGTDLVFRGNHFRSGELVVFQNSPDVFENWPSIGYENILFTNNFVEGIAGVLAAQKGAVGDSGPLTFTHNVFIDVGLFSSRYPNTTFENNTFLRVAAASTPVNSVRPHAILFDEDHTENAVVRNNIFVGCGEGRDPEEVGWYQFQGSPVTAILSHNFVAGPAPDFNSKIGFSEGIPDLNGGDPGFVDINNPTGPDGLPFTADDGLRLRPESKLAAAGEDGGYLGAYVPSFVRPALQLTRNGAGQYRLVWPLSAEGFQLETASTLGGAWSSSVIPPEQEDGFNVVTLTDVSEIHFYRLVK